MFSFWNLSFRWSEKIFVRFDEAAYSVDDGVLDLARFGDKTVKEAVALFNEAARHAEQTSV